MIRFEKVTKEYSDTDLSVSDMSFSIHAGEFVSIVGHSGAGKTTLIRLLLGEVKPTHGNIWFDDFDVDRLGTAELPAYRRRIGVVFQDFRLLPNKTAFENVAFAMEAAGKSDDEIVADVPHALDLVGLGHKARAFPNEMSGGERQRLAIARAIINQPEVILADEPTGNLDPQSTYDIIEIFKKINNLGTTVILTTHNKGIIDALGKRVITLEKGRIIKDDKHGKHSMAGHHA
jgi:cell division transport system ATP-binding protein